MGELPEPVVPPGAYDDDYYRHTCMGSEEWTRSGGAEPAGLYVGYLARARLQAGEVLVDIGTGRGELLVIAAQMGVAKAMGIEYSPAAVRLAEQTIAVNHAGDRAEVQLADARAMPVESASADLVTLLDVVEHLAPAELEATLREARRVLRSGGRLFAHTMPNRAIYDVTYRWQRALHPRRRRLWPADPRNDYERRMHVNEQTVSSLRRALRRAGFAKPSVTVGDAVYIEFVPEDGARPLYGRLARHRLTARFGAADLWAEAVKSPDRDPSWRRGRPRR